MERRPIDRRLLASLVAAAAVAFIAPAGAGAASQTGPYYDAVMAKGPAMYWRLNEASGTVVHDASGNGHTGTLHGTIAYGQPSGTNDSDPSISLDGSTGYITADSYSPFAVNGQRTFAFLVKRHSDRTGIINFFGGTGTLVPGVSDDMKFPVFETSGVGGDIGGGGVNRFRYYGSVHNQFPLYDDWPNTVPVGKFIQVVLTVDQTASTVAGLKLWVNGIPLGSPTVGFGAPNGVWVKWDAQAGPFMMGDRYTGGGIPEAEFADTTNDEVAIFERILTGAEIRDLALASGRLGLTDSAAAPTGQRAAALKKCKKKHSKKARKKCKKKAKRLPV